MSKNIRNKTSLGVELQGQEARLVLLENTVPAPTLVLAQSVRAPEELSKTLRTLPKRPSTVTSSISLQHAAVRILDLPPTTDENLERVVALEAEGVVPMGGEDLALSHHTLGMTEQSRLEVMVGAGRLAEVQNTLKTVNCAPWVSATVTVSAVALFNALHALRGANRETVAAILCIEQDSTELVVADRSRILLAQAIPVGANSEEPVPSMEPLPVAVGGGAAEPVPVSSLAPAVRSWLVTLAQQVRYPLQALSYERGLPAERLYICGSGAILPDVDIQLSERLDLPVSVLSPSGTENREHARYAVAYGCALQAAGAAPVSLNLTPARVTVARESEQRKQTQISWGALAAAVVVTGFLIFEALLHQKKQYAELLHRQVAAAPTNVEKPPLAPDELKKTRNDILEAMNGRVTAARALSAMSRALPQDAWLAEMTYGPESCVIRGFSKTQVGAQQAQVNLFNQRLFDDVSLDYQNEEKVGKSTAWGFQITCKVHPKEQKRGAVKR